MLCRSECARRSTFSRISLSIVWMLSSVSQSDHISLSSWKWFASCDTARSADNDDIFGRLLADASKEISVLESADDWKVQFDLDLESVDTSKSDKCSLQKLKSSRTGLTSRRRDVVNGNTDCHHT